MAAVGGAHPTGSRRGVSSCSSRGFACGGRLPRQKRPVRLYRA